MSAKHTPGPWEISTETRGDEVCTIHGVPTHPTEDGLGQRWVYVHYQRMMNGDLYFPSPEEKLANARLIVASPELLYALKRAVADWETTPEGREEYWHKKQSLPCPMQTPDWVIEARRVIAKAERE